MDKMSISRRKLLGGVAAAPLVAKTVADSVMANQMMAEATSLPFAPVFDTVTPDKWVDTPDYILREFNGIKGTKASFLKRVGELDSPRYDHTRQEAELASIDSLRSVSAAHKRRMASDVRTKVEVRQELRHFDEIFKRLRERAGVLNFLLPEA